MMFDVCVLHCTGMQDIHCLGGKLRTHVTLKLSAYSISSATCYRSACNGGVCMQAYICTLCVKLIGRLCVHMIIIHKLIAAD